MMGERRRPRLTGRGKYDRLILAAQSVVSECAIQPNVGAEDGDDLYFELGQETYQEIRDALVEIGRWGK
jgi:hypothetical protein